MDIQTQQTTTYAVTLNEAEVTEILVDPTKFQAKLRQIRGVQYAGKHGAKNIVIIHKKHAEKPATKNGGARGSAYVPKGATPIPCEKCGGMFKAKGMLLHLRTCKGKVSAVSAD